MDLIQEMEAYAKENGVPIMEKEGITFLCRWIETHKVKRILEIGTAIGYSTILMALVNEDIEVVSIERDEQRYQKAVDYVTRANLNDRICLIHEDALQANVKGSFDLLFIDAAKAQYVKFFERYEQYLNPGGYVVSDNLKFHGFVEHPEIIRSRHLKQMVRKIKNYILYLEKQDRYVTEFLEIGDGIAISRKKEQK